MDEPQNELQTFWWIDMFKQFDIGYDGVAIAINKPIYEAGIKALTTDQVKKIYAGQIKNWKEPGGPDKEIYAIAGEAGSGTREFSMKKS